MGNTIRLDDRRLMEVLNSLDGKPFVVKSKGWDPDDDYYVFENAGFRFHKTGMFKNREETAWAPSEAAVLAYLEFMKPGSKRMVEHYRCEVDDLSNFVKDSVYRKHRRISSYLDRMSVDATGGEERFVVYSWEGFTVDFACLAVALFLMLMNELRALGLPATPIVEHLVFDDGDSWDRFEISIPFPEEARVLPAL